MGLWADLVGWLLFDDLCFGVPEKKAWIST